MATTTKCNSCGAETFFTRMSPSTHEYICRKCYTSEIDAECKRLKTTIRNALTSLAIINMPVSGNPANSATNDDLLKIMADSFREALK